MHSTPTNLMTTASLPVDRPFFAYQHEWNSGARYHATYCTTPSPNPEAWQEYKKLIARNSTTCMTFTADDAAASGATLATGAALFDDEWLNDMKKELSAEDWKMLFMCEWPQADKEQAA